MIIMITIIMITMIMIIIIRVIIIMIIIIIIMMIIIIMIIIITTYHVHGEKVAQLVRCQTSNQRVDGSIPGHSGHFGRSWAKQFIPYCFSLPSCKMGT